MHYLNASKICMPPMYLSPTAQKSTKFWKSSEHPMLENTALNPLLFYCLPLTLYSINDTFLQTPHPPKTASGFKLHNLHPWCTSHTCEMETCTCWHHADQDTKSHTEWSTVTFLLPEVEADYSTNSTIKRNTTIELQKLWYQNNLLPRACMKVRQGPD